MLQIQVDNWLTEKTTSSYHCKTQEIEKVVSLLDIDFSDTLIVTITGTNGKGSTAALLEEILLINGISVALHTSPHLFSFNERIRYNGKNISNAELLSNLDIIDNSIQTKANEDYQIGYHQYAFLSFCLYAQQKKPEVIIFEVGLGGRLDPANIFSADIAVITSIDLDHVDLLGSTREAIAYEKLGIARSNKPIVIGDPSPPELVYSYVSENNIPAYFIDKDYQIDEINAPIISWCNKKNVKRKIIKVKEAKNIHRNNIATSLMVSELLADNLKIKLSYNIDLFSKVNLVGRCQIIQERPAYIMVDVAHNPQAVVNLMSFIATKKFKKVTAIFTAMHNKDITEILSLSNIIKKWHICSFIEAETRSAKIDYLREKFIDINAQFYANITKAYQTAISEINEDECLVVFGSFLLVADFLKFYNQNNSLGNVNNNEK